MAVHHCVNDTSHWSRVNFDLYVTELLKQQCCAR